MSGGSWDYFFLKCEDVATRLLEDRSTLRNALGKKMKLISDAMHKIEWADSGDYKKGVEDQSIIEALGEDGKALEIEILKEQGERIIKRLEELGVGK